MADIDWIFDFLPRSSWLANRTSGKDQGTAFRFDGRGGRYRLFETDTEDFRQALGLAAQPCSDFLLLWRRRRPGTRCTAIELKGGDLGQARAQVSTLLHAVRRRAPRGSLALSAVVLLRGSVNSRWRKKLVDRLAQDGIEVHFKTVKKSKGRSIPIDDLLAKIDR